MTYLAVFLFVRSDMKREEGALKRVLLEPKYNFFLF